MYHIADEDDEWIIIDEQNRRFEEDLKRYEEVLKYEEESKKLERNFSIDHGKTTIEGVRGRTSFSARNLRLSQG